MKRNLAEATAVIAFHLGFNKIKLGNEGIMLHYDLIITIAEKFCEKFPSTFNWENHYIKGGNDWDIECEDFAKKYIKDNLLDLWSSNFNFD